jgi:hypothetical protein
VVGTNTGTDFDGTADGESVGTADGESVGTADGESVGTADGESVGTADGESVGTAAGDCGSLPVTEPTEHGAVVPSLRV